MLLTMFEPENGTPGELTRFREEENLRPCMLPGTELDQTWLSPDGRVLACVVGVGTANTAVSLMALGMGSGLDLTRATWIIAGIAGGNPNVCSLGSPVWADWCVDGDLAFEVDDRDIPQEWPCGILPLGAKEPFGPSSMPPELFGRPYQVFRLHPGLAARALRISSAVELADNAGVAAARAPYEALPEAVKSPSVKLGSTLAGARFWHGPRHNAWAECWTDYWTESKGIFHSSGMEDTGSLHAINHLGRLGLTDPRRVLILRTISNFTMQPPGGDVIASLSGHDSDGEYPAHSLALENGYRAASAVYRDIMADPAAWDEALEVK